MLYPFTGCAQSGAVAAIKAVTNRYTHGTLFAGRQAVQYCSTYYQNIHEWHGLRCSMTDGYDCYQNAMAERVNGILQGECLLNRPADLKQATQMVAQSVRISNKERPHTALKYKTLDAVHQALIGS